MKLNSIPSVFQREENYRQIEKNGFLLLDAHIENEARLLREFISSNYKLTQQHFNYSLLENSFEENKIIRLRVFEILRDFYSKTFVNHKTLNESFLVKPGNTPEEFYLHQDFSYTEEKKFSAYNIWIPLTNVTEQNGAMFALAGSHRWFENYRSSSLPTARICTKNLAAEKIIKIEMNCGQVLLFNPAVFHGSYPNAGSENRVVVTATVTHRDASFLYYHQQENSGEAEVYELDEDAYLRELKSISMREKPNAPLLNRMRYEHHLVTEKELSEKANAGYDQ